MAKKNTSTDTVKKYSPEAASKRKTVVAKIVLPNLPLSECKAALDDLWTKVVAENPAIARAKGTITFF